eukprot:TRINITY_DN441_c0_g1_i5.p1 TRINITY_DN441_c0_g1~~TRINITY_DN441_c0_g1_i5.p1  ORF type:complete len:381 (-),score=68.83 TRINITY_DN441_c0_g1_i5:18-1160(-)
MCIRDRYQRRVHGMTELLASILWALLGGAFIAASSSLNLFLNGRITGMSSIFYTLITFDKKEGLIWKFLFMCGMLIPVFVILQTTQTFIKPTYYSPIGFIVGGFLVGIGTKVGNGCTSGHAVCGIPRLAKRSIVATMLFVCLGVGVGSLLGNLGWLRGEFKEYYWGQSYADTFKILSYILSGIAFLACIIVSIITYTGSKTSTEVGDIFLSIFLGSLFGIGLAVSGMCNPYKIMGFLCLNNNWDPSLIFVMISAIGINLVTFHLILKREKPLLQGKFPTIKKEFDPQVIIGPTIFGIGWGISGLCPGPGMLGFFILPQGFVFVISLAIGNITATKLILPMFASKPNQQTASTKEPLTKACLLYTSPSPRDQRGSRMPSSA